MRTSDSKCCGPTCCAPGARSMTCRHISHVHYRALPATGPAVRHRCCSISLSLQPYPASNRALAPSSLSSRSQPLPLHAPTFNLLSLLAAPRAGLCNKRLSSPYEKTLKSNKKGFRRFRNSVTRHRAQVDQHTRWHGFPRRTAPWMSVDLEADATVHNTFEAGWHGRCQCLVSGSKKSSSSRMEKSMSRKTSSRLVLAQHER